MIKKFIEIIRKRLLVALLVGAIIGLITVYASYTAISMTGTPQFCVVCHEMAPMRASYDKDVHGGMGESGIKVNCVECHLPHDNLVNYVYTKAKNGLSEVNTHFFGNPDLIDWKKKREYRASFVYDNGCIKCHTNYETNQKISAKARQMHRHYNKLKGSDKQLGCASCHAEVGHKGLNNMLNIYKPQHMLYEKGSAIKKAEIDMRLYGEVIEISNKVEEKTKTER